jgi:uncharacterized tellurite resistance protein B-like protein
MAIAALLVEAACSDGYFDDEERKSIKAILGSYYKLSDENIESLILEAEDVVQDSAQIYGFTKLVKDTYENDQRIELIEMLWEVVFADGKADAFEQNLIQRVAGLIFVSDKDRGLARKRVIDRLGINA